MQFKASKLAWTKKPKKLLVRNESNPASQQDEIKSREGSRSYDAADAKKLSDKARGVTTGIISQMKLSSISGKTADYQRQLHARVERAVKLGIAWTAIETDIRGTITGAYAADERSRKSGATRDAFGGVDSLMSMVTFNARKLAVLSPSLWRDINAWVPLKGQRLVATRVLPQDLQERLAEALPLLAKMVEPGSMEENEAMNKVIMTKPCVKPKLRHARRPCKTGDEQLRFYQAAGAREPERNSNLISDHIRRNSGVYCAATVK